MAAQAQQSDYIDDLQDPNELQAQIDAQNNNAVTNAPNAFQQNNALQHAGGSQIGQGMSRLLDDPNIGDPRVVQAKKISSAMQQIIQQSSDGADPDEDPMSKQLRLSQAVAAGMAGISPAIALKANMQAVALQEAQNQQRLLTQQGDYSAANTEALKAKTDAEKLNANYVTYGTIKGKDGLPVYKTVGDPVALYNSDGSRNPDFNKQLQANIAAAKAQGMDSPQFNTVDKFQNAKDNQAMIRAQAQANAADKKASGGMGLTNAAVANSLVMGVVAPNMITRMSREDKEAMMNFAASKGISGIDIAAAQSQMKALNSAAVAQGTRVGNIQVMEQSIGGKGGLADQVLDSLDKVDRTRFPAINAGIIAGKQAVGSPEEARYHVAMQGLITEYARVISGAQGITSDDARHSAEDILRRSNSPEAIKAAIDQIKNGELKAIQNGSDQAIELIAHPERYGAIVRLQMKAGIPVTSVADPDNLPTYGGKSVGTGGPPTRPGQTPSTGWGSVMKSVK